MKTLLLINASIAIAFGIFYELVKLCLALGLSPWVSAVTYVALYAWWWHRHCSSAGREGL
jgi:hypothetical protein